jgi:hypothetical protein
MVEPENAELPIPSRGFELPLEDVAGFSFEGFSFTDSEQGAEAAPWPDDFLWA